MANEIQTFCENMKFLRLKHNLTQKEMAKICHIGVKSISMIEKGILPERLGTNVLFTISSYFKIRPCHMFKKFLDE